MNIVTAVVGLPLAPLRGLVALAKVLRDEAERELYDPIRLRRQLEDIQSAAASGELTPEEADRAEREIIGRLTAAPAPAAGPPTEPTTGPPATEPPTTGPPTTTHPRTTQRPRTGRE